MSLSSTELIENNIQRSVNGFSVVDTMGDLAVNRRFKQGYNEMQLGQHTKDSYIWEALSAVSQNLGEAIYSDVMHYIDNVSNVDVCRIKSLRSMLQQVGLNYLVLDKIQFYPIEIQHLIGILSINKKYLLDNKFIKQSFIDDLVQSKTIQLSNDVDGAAASAGNISSTIDRYVYDQSTFNDYLLSTFYNFIYDMLDMYIVPEEQLDIFLSSASVIDNSISSACKAYAQIQLSDGYGSESLVTVDKYRQYKKTANIDMSFDVEAEVDKIEVGQASIDDYSGDELSLIQMEIADRSTVIAQISSCTTVSMMSRNAYYRKKKVIEYAKFVDNLIGVDFDISAYQTYQYDPHYYLNPDRSLSSPHSLSGVGTSQVGIVDKYVQSAASRLVDIVNYTNKVREVIRQQVRKVYMKGTNNLLEFAINEFLIDYANQLQQVFPKEQVSTVMSQLSAHSVQKVKVQEYWDHNEYFNISAATSNKYAYNYGLVNSRYFDNTFKLKGDALVPEETMVFTNEELNTFYLSSLGLATKLEHALSNPSRQGYTGLSSNFYDFLSVLFDIAADPSYYDAQYNVFGSKLSNQIITHDIHNDLCTLKEVSAVVTEAAAKANFEFTGISTIMQQKDALFEALTLVLQEEYLSSVSALYDEYQPQIQQISSDFDGEKSKLSTYLNQTYSHYFCKSTNSYSYDDNGNYLFDYFIGNRNYLTDDYYILQLNQASSWITEHCHTYPLSNAIDRLSSEYTSIRAQIYSDIVDNIQLCGFIDLSLVDLAEEMDSIKAFLKERISDRTSYLQQALENFRSQANQLKSTYDECAASFQQVLASMPDTSQGWYIKWVGNGAGDLKRIDSNNTEADDKIYDQYSQGIYKSVDSGPFKAINFKNGKIDATKLLVDNVNAAKSLLGECSEIFYGFVKGSASSTVSRSYGSQTQALDAILASLGQLGKSIDSIVDQVSQMYQIDKSSGALNAIKIEGSTTGTDYLGHIIKLIEYLGTSVGEAEFSKDLVLASYNEYNKTLTNISAEYIPSRNEYEVLWSKFTSFLQEFEKTSDYKVFKPENIDRLYKYYRDKDAKALSEIQQDFGQLYETYQSLIDKFIAICANKIEMYKTIQTTYVYEYSGDVLEECLVDLTKSLVKDIQMKEEIGNKGVDDYIERIASSIDIVTNGERSSGVVGLYKKYFPTDLVPLSASYSEYEMAFDSQYVAFTDVLDQLLNLLEYSNYGSFNESKMMFKNYTGITAKTISADQLVADDPYYNHKNLTHPSYQIHPFLWNFSEKSTVQQAIDMVANSYASIDFDDLEGRYIAKSLDKYLGQFGQLIDVWKNHVKDFTSYLTRYEQSNHICRYTNVYNEMVDYDGAFYPPALSSYIANSSWSSMALFYSHLNLEADESMQAKIANCLQSNSTLIRGIAKDSKALSAVEDIFKYEIDTYGNMYILYKRYDTPTLSSRWANGNQPSYIDKLYASGQLWIRLCDSPLAFPIGDIADVDGSSKVDSGRIGLDGQPVYLNISQLDIIDFEIVPAGKKICIAYRDQITGQPKCIAFYIDYATSNGCGLGNLRMLSYDTQSSSNYQSLAFPDSIVDASQSSFYRYIGMFSSSMTTLYAAFIQCNFEAEDQHIVESSIAIPDNPMLKLYKVQSGKTVYEMASYSLGVADVCSKDVAMSFYDDGSTKIDLAFAVSQSIGSTSVKRLEQSISVDLSSDTEGYAYSDPIHMDMNSFDAFNQKVEIVTIDTASTVGMTKSSSYQTNADIGYIPSYAGLSVSGPLSIATELDECHQAVELLGKSKDIDKLIDAVNAAPDPYLTKEDIYDKFMFGRVWENEAASSINGYRAQDKSSTFSYDKDQSLVILANKSMYQNMPTIADDTALYSYADGRLYWQVKLDRYQQIDLSNLKVFLYATKALGKNPYIINDMSAIIRQSMDGDISANYNNEGYYDINNFSLVLSESTIRVSGTNNGINEVDYNFSNALDNVLSVGYKYNGSSDEPTLDIWFELSSTSTPCFIEKDALKLALIDVFDMRFFEWFHLLDQGATYEDAIEELGRVHGNPFAREQLLAIDLSKYNALSDVQVDAHRILDSYRKMSFKLDEQDNFPLSNMNYYVPSLNIKYPLSFAQVYSQNYIQNNVDPSMVAKVFQQDELYVLNAQDKEVLSAIGEIAFDIDRFDARDEIRVYEDYRAYDSELCMYNLDKFPLEDPQFYQYAHFAGNNINTAGQSLSGIEVPEDRWKSIEVQLDSSSGDAFSTFLQSNGLSTSRSEELIDNTFLTSKIAYSQLTPAQKEQLLDYAAKFLRIYMNYKKTPNGIVLYANYQNYINSPFMKIENGKPYVDTIPGTYAKILPDESEKLDIIVQFRQYLNGQISGYKNVIAATYQIYNVSDDKPKFVIKKLSDIASSNDSQLVEEYVHVQAQDYYGHMSEPLIDYSVFLTKNVTLQSSVQCIVTYPSKAVSIVDSSIASGSIEKLANGTLKLAFTNSIPALSMQFAKSSDFDAKWKGKRLPISIVEVSSEDSHAIDIKNGSITID